jgi:heme exporter protein A
MLRLQATNIGKRFGTRILFRKMSFELSGGGPVAITGSNGSGKSTLVRILAGVLRPSRGSISLLVNDKLIKPEHQPFHVGLVAPYLNLYEALSPSENLRFIARSRGMKEADRQIDLMLTKVGLFDRKDDYISTFSSGMKQRVRIAAALFCEPEVLLLDEPRSNLDEAGRVLVSEVIQSAAESGKIVVVATNDDLEAAQCQTQIRIQDYY